MRPASARMAAASLSPSTSTKVRIAGAVATSGEDGSGAGFVAHRFDVVPVRADDESGIVVAAVLRAQAGRSVVLATRLQGRAMERLHLLAIFGHECEVKVRRLLGGLVQDQ